METSTILDGGGEWGWGHAEVGLRVLEVLDLLRGFYYPFTYVCRIPFFRSVYFLVERTNSNLIPTYVDPIYTKASLLHTFPAVLAWGGGERATGRLSELVPKWRGQTSGGWYPSGDSFFR